MKKNQATRQTEALIKDTAILSVFLFDASASFTIITKKIRFNLCLRQETTDTLSYGAGVSLGQNHITMSTKDI